MSEQSQTQQLVSNNKRKFTFLFQYPASGRYYISLLPYTITKYICSLYGSPYNCFFLHEYANEGPYNKLQRDDELVVVEYCDDIGEPCHQVRVFPSNKEICTREEDEDEK